jgi:hypothetical protein
MARVVTGVKQDGTSPGLHVRGCPKYRRRRLAAQWQGDEPESASSPSMVRKRQS